jgi:hypothetical protein
MTLQTAPGTGGLSFTTNPPGAVILLEGIEYPAKTPAAINNIPTGSHPFVLKMEGYKDFTDAAEVVESRLCCIDTTMTPSMTESLPESKTECSTTPLEIAPVPPVTTQPDYKMLIVGIFAGIGVILLLERIFGKAEKK